jgi:hypothetical protein
MRLGTVLLLTLGVVAGSVTASQARVEQSKVEQSANPSARDTKQGQAQSPGKRPATEVGKLLDRLDELHPQVGKDEWACVLRDLIKHGRDAIPELSAELDATNDAYMLRCLGFVMRGIGDKRALPALIRALPKTCVGGGSDCGFIANDPELLEFMQKHDKENGRSRGMDYSFGRPISEFRVTLQKMTGLKQGEDEIVHIFLDGTPQRQYLQRALYHRCAERWAKWWDLNWKRYIDDERYSKVNLEPLGPEPNAVKAFPQGPNAKIDGRRSGHILESVHDVNAKHVFLDLDTGRQCGLPRHLRAAAGHPERLDDILAWAAREGFDLMGTEYTPPGGQPHYVLRGLGLTLWQIDTDRWETLEAELRDAKPLDMGTRTDGLLARFSVARGQYEPEETATFLFKTREGGYGAIFVGVEVHDDGLQPGGVLDPSTEELKPVAFYKGRRFAYSMISGPGESGEVKQEGR